MAKSRVTINPMYTGGAGGYSFYVRGGEQVVRQRKNNSNYGEGASRSYAQMIRRIMWGNLVNVYKKMKDWQKKAYDAKLQGQTDYNIFMKLNINNVHVGVTKQACEQGFGVWEPYQISNGSMPPVGYSVNTSDSQYETDIVVKEAIIATTTIGALSADILANNPQFQDGDNIAFIFFSQQKFLGVDWPYPYCKYTEITLNTADTRLVADIPELGERLSESLNDTLIVSYTTPSGDVPSREVGFASIHTRKTNGVLSVSTQNIVLNTQAYVQQYSGNEWYDHCIESYGIDTEVPLDPNFNDGVISSVTANGASLANAATLSGSQVIRVYGNSLYGQGYRFVHNGIDYTPLSSTDEYDEYILTANGSYVIYVGNQVYMSFSVTGASYPTEMSGTVSAIMIDSSQVTIEDTTQATDDYCLNYVGMLGGDAVEFRCLVWFSDMEDVSEEDFEAVGGTISRYGYDTSRLYSYCDIAPSDPDGVVYLKYKGRIVFVGNYTD